MESLIDITTTAFQAVVAVCVVFTAGYAYAGKYGSELGLALGRVASNVLLPCQLFVVLAASPTLTWRVFFRASWPALVLALVTHGLSILYGLLLWRYVKSPAWILETSTYNNVSSYPLLLTQAMYMVSRVSTLQGLWHLKWRSMEGLNQVVERVTLYVLLNLIVTEFARLFLLHLLPKQWHGLSQQPALQSQGAEVIPSDAEEASETTPLVVNGDNKHRPEPTVASRLSKLLAPSIVATIIGLLVGMIKPLQRFVVGSAANEHLTGLWNSLGAGLVILGASFATVHMLSIGASLRAAEVPTSDEEKVPPILGTVLLLTFWRYIIIPVITISIVYGFRQIPSTHSYLQDPAYSFVLGMIALSPPAPPRALSAFQSAVHYNLSYVALITPISIAVLFGISGRGISSDVNFDLVRALKSAAGGGIAGAAAMVIQVLSLMPLRTIMNYQYRYGGTLKNSVKSLWNDGGFKRYYAGLGAAIFQGPLSRFGDTAANAGILALLESVQWPVLIKTIAASLASACFRMTLTPIDTLKTTQQTRGGKAGLQLLRERVKVNGVGCLWWGALATAAATFVGHYPWFGTYNWLSDVLPPPHNLVQKLARQAFIGFAASVVSDTVSNSLRVVKTYRQVHERDVGYWTAAKEIVASEGILGLFGRGLPVRLLTNGLQGLLFSILWKLFADLIAGKR